MSFLRKWLRPQRPPGVALHPTRAVELDVPAAQAFERARYGVEHVLGGIVRESQGGTLEAAFGLIDSERLTIAVEPLSQNRSRVTVESRRRAGSDPGLRSPYVDALCAFLLSE